METASLLIVQPLLVLCSLKKGVTTHSNGREVGKDPESPWRECLQQYLIIPHKTLGQKEGDRDQEAPRGKLSSLWLGARAAENTLLLMSFARLYWKLNALFYSFQRHARAFIMPGLSFPICKMKRLKWMIFKVYFDLKKKKKKNPKMLCGPVISPMKIST